MKIRWDCVEWGRLKNVNPSEYQYYFYWWNWLPKEARYWGLEYIYYDGPHITFGLWFANLLWWTPWSTYRDE